MISPWVPIVAAGFFGLGAITMLHAAGSASDIPKQDTSDDRDCAVVLPEGVYKQIKPGKDGTFMGNIIVTNVPDKGMVIKGTCTIYNNHIKQAPHGK